QAEHLGGDDERWIARSVGHARNQARRGELLRKGNDFARNLGEIKLQCRVEFKEPAQLRLPEIIETGLEAVPSVRDADVVFELPLSLEGLLGNIGVGSEGNSAGEGESWSLFVLIDQVVPVLPARRGLVHDVAGEQRIHREVRNLELVRGEVAAAEIVQAVGLIILAVVALRGIAQVGAMLVIELVVCAPVVAGIEIRGWDDRHRLRSQGLNQGELREGVGGYGKAGVFTLPLVSEEEKRFVLLNRATNAAAEQLPAVGRFGLVRRLGDGIIMSQGLVQEKPVQGAVIA